MAMVGNPGEAPPLLRVSLGDMYTGISRVAAICAALLGRVKSGKGQHIDLSLYDCLVSIHDYAVQCYTLSGGKDVPEQSGCDMPQLDALRRVHRVSDGHLVIAAQVDDAWKRLALLIGGEALCGRHAFPLGSAGATNTAWRFWPLVRKAWVAARKRWRSALSRARRDRRAFGQGAAHRRSARRPPNRSRAAWSSSNSTRCWARSAWAICPFAFRAATLAHLCGT
jgi:crotonobetainyl-CoA:carnitine CoA-transferase CaiB-like acyl-CoA transferase